MAQEDAPRRHGGRPKKANKRTKMVQIRLTEDEHAAMVEKAKAWSRVQRHGSELMAMFHESRTSTPMKRPGLSPFLRHLALEGAVLLERPGVIEHQAWMELSRLANNLNQIARRLNSLDPSLLSDVSELHSDVLETKERVEELQDVFLEELSKEVLEKIHRRVSAALEESS